MEVGMKSFFPALQYFNVPNAFTTLGLLFGIAACYLLAAGNVSGVIICLFLSTFIDFVDGFFAIKLNQQTNFGQYMDSIVDFFICCAIPVFMLYTLSGGSALTVTAAVVYCVCGLWRLAYYISVTAAEKQSYYTGLPVPGGMLLSVASIWLVTSFELPVWICTVVFVLTGLLMASSIKLKKYGLCQKLLCVLWPAFMVAVYVF